VTGQSSNAANGQGVATMCPICMATLKEASDGELEINDISCFLAKAYLDRNLEGMR